VNIPDLIGIKIDTALDELKSLEISHKIIVNKTVSPFSTNKNINNECRVVRQKILDNTIEITVSYF
jgi:hypothetical protein